ncbi:ATP12 family chaperone protein [Paracoccus sp. p4-l81]|uniref:ATP12 family chaperone protein n=1 Tax=unclassified Paracoccus (in: a-proteobacteria) TaxID=2688777 RepID=UPI0035B729ED
MSSEWKARRFWTKASVTTADTGFGVALDGRPVKTPAKRPLVVPTRALAAAIAAEWDAQEQVIDPESMPLTRAANAAIDKVTIQAPEVAAMLAAYAETDLICHRASDEPELIARQDEGWNPLLDWCAAQGLPLVAGPGVLPHAQPPASLAGYAARLSAMSPWDLTALHDLVALTGSLVLGLAVFDGRLGADQAWHLSRIDEDWQAERWGRDDEAVEAAEVKRAAHARAARLLALLRDNPPAKA